MAEICYFMLKAEMKITIKKINKRLFTFRKSIEVFYVTTAEQMSLYNFIILRKKQWTQMKT